MGATGGAAASAVATLVGSIFAALFRVNVFRPHALTTLGRVNVVAALIRVNIMGWL